MLFKDGENLFTREAGLVQSLGASGSEAQSAQSEKSAVQPPRIRSSEEEERG